MTDFITLGGAPFYPCSRFADDPGGTFASGICNRQTFVSTGALLLRETCGAYCTIAGRPLPLIVDPRSVVPGSPQWLLIGAAAQRLEEAVPKLDAQAMRALGALKAVIFLTSPDRAYSDVKGAQLCL